MKSSHPKRQTTNDKRQTSSFTLIEVIIAMTLFAILSTSGVVLIDNVSRANKKVEMEEYLYTESQALIERLTRTIQASGIDYEEYYNRYVEQGAKTNTSANYGINYSAYHEQFFNPSTQFETGRNPYEGSTQSEDEANALCENNSTCTTTPENHQMEELYLINRAGTQKMIFVLEEGSLAFVQLKGFDDNGDGLKDTWSCTNEFTCTAQNPEKPSDSAYKLPLPSDKTDGVRDNENFIPISPQNLFIDSFKLYISPIEDPYKAYNEASISVYDSVQIHPKVTIVYKAHYRILDANGAEIPFEQSGNYIGEAPKITLQTTVGTGIYNEIPTYAP